MPSHQPDFVALRRGLAQNPAAPVEVLLRLLDRWPEVACEGLARRPALPEALQNAMVQHPNRLVRRTLARHLAVTPSLRERLLADPDWQVFLDACGDRGRRPVSDDALVRVLTRLEEPFEGEILTADELRMEVFMIMSAAFRRLSRLAATHPLPAVRSQAATNPKHLTESMRQALLVDPEPEVRTAIADALAEQARVMQPADLNVRSSHVLAWVLQRPLSREVVERVLAEDDVEKGLYWVAGNPTTPPDVVETLIAHPATMIREQVAERADLTTVQLLRLADDPDAGVRTAVSVHPGLTEAQRAGIAIDVGAVRGHDHYGPGDQCPEPWTPHADETVPVLDDAVRWARSVNPLLRRRAARNRELSPDLVTELTDDPDLGVRVILARCHPQAPPALLLRCVLEYHGCGRRQLSELPQFPVAGLHALADHADPVLRSLVARDPQVAPDLVRRLIADPNIEVRAAMARCPRLPTADLVALLNRPESAEPAAANPALPAEWIQRILDRG